MHRSTLRHMLVAAFAASALLTSTAIAKPVERADRFESPTSSLAGTTESNLAPKQDLRGEHARDAARVHVAPSRGNAVYWAYDYQAPKPASRPASAPAAKPHDTDNLWLVLGIAFGASAIYAGTALVFTRRTRIPA
jgi:hypothetical protein